MPRASLIPRPDRVRARLGTPRRNASASAGAMKPPPSTRARSSSALVEDAGLARRDAEFAGSARSTSPPPRGSGRSSAGAGGRVERTRAEIAAPPPAERQDRAVADPVDVAQRHARASPAPRAGRRPPAPRGVEPHHEQRLAARRRRRGRRALADGVMDDAVVAAEHAAVQMDDVARHRRARAQALDDVGVTAARHEADVLAVGLVGDGQAEAPRELARTSGLAQSPSGKRSKSSCSRVVAKRK